MNENKALGSYTNQSWGNTMNASRSALTSYFLVFAVIFSIGCYQDATAPTGAGRQDLSHLLKTDGPLFARPGDTSNCNTVSDILLLPTDSLVLKLGESRVNYRGGSVSQTTPVSFSICELDTIGTALRPKAAVFGPFSNQVFLHPFKVRLSVADAGLPSHTPTRGYYKLFRLNEFTGVWDSVKVGRVAGLWVIYEVSRNGTYAVTFDTTWTTSGVIPPGGGTLDLFNSTINFPPGALSESTLVSFRITTGVTPVGLPGATDRVFDFSPDGIVFLIPVTLYVSFAEAGINEAEEKVPMLRFYYFDPMATTWVRQPTAIDWQNRRFIVTLSHFSRYAFGR